MKQFNLNEYLVNPQKKIVTRDGRPVRIICTDRENEYYPIIALIKTPHDETTIGCTKDGEYEIGSESKCDIFFATEKHEGWIRIYKYDFGDTFIDKNMPMPIFSSKEEADRSAKNDRRYVKAIKIEWEEDIL